MFELHARIRLQRTVERMRVAGRESLDRLRDLVESWWSALPRSLIEFHMRKGCYDVTAILPRVGLIKSLFESHRI